MQNLKLPWLIDVAYVVKASTGRFKLDYIKAKREVTKRLGDVSMFLFNGVDATYGIPPGLQKFYEAMRIRGATIRLQPMQSGSDFEMNRQRRVDVDLCSHMVWLASRPEVDTLLLTTGDQDFVPAVEVVQKMGKKVILYSFDACVHHDLSSIVDDWWLFEQEKEQIARH